jgi:hypothetical protein
MEADAHRRTAVVLTAVCRLMRPSRVFNVCVGSTANAARGAASHTSTTHFLALARRAVVGPVCALVLLGAGCSASEPDAIPTGDALPPAPSSTSLGSSAAAERDALAAYRGMWSAFVEAGKTSDPDAPDLRRYASDQALRLMVGSLVTDRELTKVTKGDLVLDPKVSQVTPVEAPAEVTVLDCVDSTRLLKYRASGELWDDKPGGRHRTTATVKVADGTWKVSAFILEELGTC